MTRAEAIKRGLPRYSTGKPCCNGHRCERYTATWQCVECCRVNQRRHYRKLTPDQIAARTDRSRELRGQWPSSSPEYQSRYHSERRRKQILALRVLNQLGIKLENSNADRSDR